MNKKVIFSVMLVCLLVFVTVFAVSCTKAYAQTSPNVRWEYTRVFTSTYDQDIVKANELGQVGWELVSSFSGGLVFKRRLP